MASKGYRFVGQGQFTGVKSADLTAEAFDRLDPRAKRIVRTSGAWEELTVAETRKLEKEAAETAAKAEAEANDAKGGES
jgi:hypothetical protein